jgi:hypothetical protein
MGQGVALGVEVSTRPGGEAEEELHLMVAKMTGAVTVAMNSDTCATIAQSSSSILIWYT